MQDDKSRVRFFGGRSVDLGTYVSFPREVDDCQRSGELLELDRKNTEAYVRCFDQRFIHW